MNFYEVVYELAAKKHMSIEKLSLKLGRTSRYVGRAKIRGSIPKVSNAAMILDACDYVLCAIPDGDVPEDAYVFE